jgi:hypothetical protein
MYEWTTASLKADLLILDSYFSRRFGSSCNNQLLSGVALTTHPHLRSRLKKEKIYTFSSLCLHVMFWGEIYILTFF